MGPFRVTGIDVQGSRESRSLRHGWVGMGVWLGKERSLCREKMVGVGSCVETLIKSVLTPKKDRIDPLKTKGWSWRGLSPR